MLLGPSLLPVDSENPSLGICQLEVVVAAVAAVTAARMAYSEGFVGDQTTLGPSVVRIVPMSKSTSVVVRYRPHRSRTCSCRFIVICGIRIVFLLPWLRIFCAVVITVRHLR